MQASVHSGVEGLQELRSAWTKLHQSLGPYAKFEWHLACAVHLLGACSHVSYILVSEGVEPIAIVPVIESVVTMLPFGRLRALSLGLHSQLSLVDIPVSPGIDFSAIAAVLRPLLWRWPRAWDVLWWQRCLADGNAARLGRALGATQGQFAPTPPCNVLDLGESFEEFMHQRSKNLLNSLRKSGRKLSESSGVYVSRNGVPQALNGELAPAVPVETTEMAFDHFLDLEASGWKGIAGTGTAIKLDPMTREFYAFLLRERKPGFDTEIALLHREHRPIAAHFSITTAAGRTVLKIGYDESESKVSPGQILLREVLETIHRQGTRELSLVTNMPWHHTWRPRAEPTHSVLIYRRRWRHEVHWRLRRVFRLLKVAVRFTGVSKAQAR